MEGNWKEEFVLKSRTKCENLFKVVPEWWKQVKENQQEQKHKQDEGCEGEGEKHLPNVSVV